MMRNNAVFVAVVAILLVFSTRFCNAQGEIAYTIRPMLPAGDYTMNQAISADIVTQILGQTIPNKNSSAMTWDLASKSPASGGTQEITMKLSRVRIKITLGVNNFDYDSGNREELEKIADPMIKKQFEDMDLIFRTVMENSLTVVLGADGKVEDVRGINEMREAVKSKMTDAAAKNNAQRLIGEMIEKMFQNKNFYSGGQDFFPPAGKKVKVGEEWTNKASSDVPMLGEVETSSHNTLKSVDLVDGVPVATIETKTSTEDLSGTKVERGAVRVTYRKMDIGGLITSKVNLKTQQLLMTTATMTINAEVEMPNPQGGEPMTAKLTGTVKSGTRFDMKVVKP